MERLVVCTVATTVPKLHWWSPMEPIWRLRWSGGDEVGATGGHVDQQLEDDDGHYIANTNTVQYYPSIDTCNTMG